MTNCTNCDDESTVHKYDAHWCFACFVDEVLRQARENSQPRRST